MIKSALGVLNHQFRVHTSRRPLPRILTWTTNFRCNAQCGMCDSWKKENDGELDTSQALSVVAKLPKSITAVRLTGGEPFLRSDLDTITQALDEHLRPDLIHITSNGFLTRRIEEFLSQRRQISSTPLHLLISLDGGEELHNQIRGRPFAYRTAWETIQMVAGSARKWGVELAVNQTVVDERGILEYDALHQKLTALGVSHHVVIAYAESATYSTEQAVDLSPSFPGAYKLAHPIESNLLKTFLDRLQTDFHALPLKNRIGKSYYLQGIRNRLLESQSNPNPPCAALGGHLRIFPNGDIPVCQFNSKVVGNLLQDDFERVWNSPEVLKSRAWVGRCPGCWAECEVLPSALLSGDILWQRPRAKVGTSGAPDFGKEPTSSKQGGKE